MTFEVYWHYELLVTQYEHKRNSYLKRHTIEKGEYKACTKCLEFTLVHCEGPHRLKYS